MLVIARFVIVRCHCAFVVRVLGSAWQNTQLGKGSMLNAHWSMVIWIKTGNFHRGGSILLDYLFALPASPG